MLIDRTLMHALLGATVVASGVVGTSMFFGTALSANAGQSGATPEIERVETSFASIELEAWTPRSSGAIELRMRVEPQEGIHIYAPGQPGYYPVSLTFPGNAGIKGGRLELPPSEPYTFAPTGEKFQVYTRKFIAVQHATLVPGGAAATTGRIPVTLRYQACDEAVCYKPQVVNLVWTRRAGQQGSSGKKP
jgi:hypothetical protein